MTVNKKRLVVGAGTLGIAAVLATGVGVAYAETTPSPGQGQGSSQGLGQGPGQGRGGGMGQGQGRGMGAHGGVGGGVGTGARGGVGAGQGTQVSAAADYLGLSVTDLRTRLQQGKSLADVAGEKGKPVEGLKDAMITARKKALDAATTLTAEQKATCLAQLESRVTEMINRKHVPGTGRGNRA